MRIDALSPLESRATALHISSTKGQRCFVLQLSTRLVTLYATKFAASDLRGPIFQWSVLGFVMTIHFDQELCALEHFARLGGRHLPCRRLIRLMAIPGQQKFGLRAAATQHANKQAQSRRRRAQSTSTKRHRGPEIRSQARSRPSDSAQQSQNVLGHQYVSIFSAQDVQYAVDTVEEL
jgi:hypothetical protein